MNELISGLELTSDKTQIEVAAKRPKGRKSRQSKNIAAADSPFHVSLAVTAALLLGIGLGCLGFDYARDRPHQFQIARHVVLPEFVAAKGDNKHR